MKLLFVVPEYGPSVTGGIATFYRHLLPALVRRGHAAHVVLADNGPGPAPAPPPGVTLARVGHKAIDAESGRFDALAAVPVLQRRLARAWAAWRLAGEGEGFDLVETADFGTLFAPWAALPSGPPVLVQLHASNGQIMTHDPIAGDELEACVARLVEASLLGRADELQSYGGPNAREWAGRLGREVVHLWPAWRAEGEPGPATLPEGVEGLVVGRVQCWKGPEVLCQALRRLGPNAPVIGWVGDDTHYRHGGRWTSQHLAATYPDVWGRKLLPLGRRLPAEVAALQAAARFVVVPSTWDVFNLVAAEAMGRSRVVVCSEGAGAAELIRDGENGFRCLAGDAAALADRVRVAHGLGDAERRQVGEAARETVVKELDPDRIAAQRLARYEALVSRRPQRRGPDLSGLFGTGELLEEPLAFLDRMPLRRLVRYSFRRAWARLRRALGR
jgi:glycosyltransferase involved in cell wall biosynthesis